MAGYTVQHVQTEHCPLGPVRRNRALVLSRRGQLPQQTVQNGEYGLQLRVRDFRVEQLYGCGVHF